MKSIRDDMYLYVILIGILFVLWQSLYWAIGDTALRSPWQTMVFTWDYVQTEYFWTHFIASLVAFGWAMFYAALIGLGIGFILGFHKLSGEVFTPIVASIASVPKITLYPIFLLSFGLGMSAKVAFGALHGITPIAIFTVGAIANIRPVFLRVGKTMQLTPEETMRQILLPAALPEIFSGVRIGFSLTLIGTLLGEMFAAQYGLGFLLMNAIGLHNVDVMMCITLVMVVIAGLFSVTLLAIDRQLRSRL